MARAKFSFSSKRLRQNEAEYRRKVKAAIEFLCEYHAAHGVAEMKTNAPWTDRTSAARNGLYTVVEKSAGHYTIIFAHTVHYGIWLEVKFSGRDAIIMPTVLAEGIDLQDNLRELIQ